MPFSALDIAVLGVTLISAVLAAVRGFAREVLGIAAWVVAALAAWFLHGMLLPFAHQYISHDTVALVVTIAAIFIVTLLVMSLITVQISDLILDSRIGAMDRTLGLLFGIARGFLICVLGWLLFTTFLQGKNVPAWAESAVTRPFLQSTSESLRSTFSLYAEKYSGTWSKKQSDGSDASSPPPESTQQPSGTTN